MANYIRSLSQDVLINKESKTYKGYTLFAPQFGNIAWLIDMEGNVCHFWEMKDPPGVNYYLNKKGNLMWLGRGDEALKELGGCASYLIEVDWNGNEVWRYDDPRLHHDFKIMDNGNIMVLRFETLPPDIQKRIKGGAPDTELPDGSMMGIQIQEITREKKVVWEWSNWEHFDFERHQECGLCNRLSYGYTNSVDVFPNGDPVISVREMNKVMRISKQTGDIVWEIGPELDLGHQHDVDVLPNGNITLFDNGVHRVPRGHDTPDEIASFCTSRVLEIDPLKSEIVWEYTDPTHIMFTNFCGSTEKLPNGNYFICESRTGTFYEITPEKEVAWKYISPFVIPRPDIFGWTAAKLVFQAHRYSADFEGFKERDLDPDQYEWTISKKDQTEIDEEEITRNRLTRAGY